MVSVFTLTGKASMFVFGILPQVLAALGSLFTAAGVGAVIAAGVGAIIPEGNHFIAVAVYCIGMALFTMIMGNGFAAFAVITVGIGYPFSICCFKELPVIPSDMPMMMFGDMVARQINLI